MDMNEFCAVLPKLELHAHLNGSLSEATLKELGCLTENVSEYQKLSSVLNKSSIRTLDECFSLFAIAHNATNNPKNVYEATKSVIREFERDNVIYLEIRSTPREELSMTKSEYVESIIKAIQESSCSVKLILSIDRRHTKEQSLNTLEIATKFKDLYPNIIKGLDLCGNPNEGCWHKEIFEEARKRGLLITLHCGEVNNAQEIMEMLRFKPDRIGHGTFIKQNEEAWKEYLREKIPIECCLTSNVICGTVSCYKDHHLKEWFLNKLPFTISTDDKGVFNSTLTQEYIHAAENFQLTMHNLYDISLNSVSYCFGSEEEKAEIRCVFKNFYNNMKL